MEKEKLWKYYKALAESLGIDAEGNPRGYSVAWFYDAPLIPENTLTNAFLGDEAELEHVSKASEQEIGELHDRIRQICGERLYDAQIEAVSNAILNDLTIIQGPPGTGKTETIKNMVLCIRRLRPEARIAIVSANAEAINNAEDAVKKETELQDLYARLGRKSIRRAFRDNILRERTETEQLLENCNESNEYLFPLQLLDMYPIIFSTIHSLRKCVNVPEYDYVIVDECSQVQSMIGILAMATARHLILLGDDEQLPPVYKKMETDTLPYVEEIRELTPWYLDEKDNSFMKACRERFGDKCGRILLNEHYRCHPAIIGFCNRYIYENRLETKTIDDGSLPIRIRWYEGDYWERVEVSNEESSWAKNYNRKQIEVFIEDELPIVRQKLRDDPDYSICVLSPYRYQLEELKERLNKVVGIDDAIDNEVEQPDENVNDIPQLTIHKAQGRGYDCVYILPVQDVGYNPWSQKKELINVAVSRAKKELCVITSAAWMPREWQQKELGYYYYSSEHGDGYYVRNLLQYVYDEAKTRDCGEQYGFLKSSVISVFDRSLYFRQKYKCSDEKTKEDAETGASAPERCMLEALKKGLAANDEYDILTEVPIKAIQGISADSPEVEEYIENGARFDFVLCKGVQVCAIIEVDGAYHRSDAEIKQYDELKNLAVSSLGDNFVRERYMRFPTDGTTRGEIFNLPTNNGLGSGISLESVLEGKMSRFLGRVMKDNSGWYKFSIEKIVNDNGLVSIISGEEVFDMISSFHGDWNYDRFFHNYSHQITLRINPTQSTEELDNAIQSQSTMMFSIDLKDNITLNGAGTGFMTVDSYTGIPVLPNLDEAYAIHREELDKVINSVGEVVNSARESLREVMNNFHNEQVPDINYFASLDPQFTRRDNTNQIINQFG